MPTPSHKELINLYRHKIRPAINELEIYRKKFLQKSIITTIFIIPPMFIMQFKLVPDIQQLLHLSSQDPIVFTSIGILLIGALFAYLSYQQLKLYRRFFKRRVVKIIIQAINSNFIYSPNKYITRKEFDKSHLFKHKHINRFHGDDYVTGKLNDIQFHFSEIDAKKVTGSGKNKHTVTIFHGIYVILDLPNRLQGHTLIYPDLAEKIFGSVIGRFLQKRKTVLRDDQLIELEDINFEKHYVVYADDQIEARYVLTPDIMENLLAFRKKYKFPIYIDIFPQKAHIGIATGSIFEPGIFQKAVTFKSVKQIAETFQLIENIITSLKLSPNKTHLTN